MIEENPEKYPKRMGQSWEKSEDDILLKEINDGISIDDIAKKHERTTGSITARLRVLAYNLYNIDKKTINDIKEITKLTDTEIEIAIKKKEKADNQIKENNSNDMKEIISLLKDIQIVLYKILTKDNH